jgi:hypothetical protein
MRVNEEGEGGQICFVYLVYVYESRAMKLAEITLQREEKGDVGERWRG